MSSERSRARILGWPVAAAATLIAAVVFAGCGGSSAGEATAKEVGSNGSSGQIVKSHDAVSKTEGSTQIETALHPTGEDTDEESVTGAKPIKPCTLVTRAQAGSILGGRVKIAEHLQGPTCVFSGSGREVTLVVMEARVKPLVAGAHESKAITIAGHHAWCVRYETTSVVTAVGGGRVLQVTGACPAAARFAAAALPRIPS
jgi:hypothetical protein